MVHPQCGIVPKNEDAQESWYGKAYPSPACRGRFLHLIGPWLHIYRRMQQKVVVNKGKRYIVNVASNDDGVGAGFAVGQLVMKSYTNGLWYITTASGSAPNAIAFVSQSALPFQSGSIYTQSSLTASALPYPSFYEQNFPYQIVGCNDEKGYQVYLTGNTPTVTLTVSQSAIYPNAYITNSFGAIIDIAKPYLLLQSISDLNYYRAYLFNNAGTIQLRVDQTMVSQSWVHPIF